ncbi:hypothetical protein CC80DRAFT_306253 [Byssothecium circinans]|uniref:Uncharacterized protein n=1 Tax=Byssothecium circinans TaxID=147558 RepID=A0A6A5U5J7_9PLEO|nr:hypothetical protein CC80DRAFT_306253 [Byssothecium circinans]
MTDLLSAFFLVNHPCYVRIADTLRSVSRFYRRSRLPSDASNFVQTMTHRYQEAIIATDAFSILVITPALGPATPRTTSQTSQKGGDALCPCQPVATSIISYLAK